MKKLLFLMGSALILLSCENESKAVPGQKTTMEVNEVFEAGTVMQGEIIKAKFNVKNTGTYPLVLGEVKGSCTCTVADYPDEPIAPGETAVIEAEVDTEKTGTGDIAKNVYIMANTANSTTTVLIKGKVKPRK